MKHHYVNRESRPDRNFLFRGAMASQGVAVDDLIRHVGMDRDDYPDAMSICEAAREEFPDYFNFHIQYPQRQVAYGLLLWSWNALRVWREIANGTEHAGVWVDDFALKVSTQKVEQLVDAIEPDILQLTWHHRNDVFIDDIYRLPVQYEMPGPLPISSRDRRVFQGTRGAGDWTTILSPQGAAMLIEFIGGHPYYDAEIVILPFYLATRHPGVFSVRANNPECNGLTELFGNSWIVQLWRYTDSAHSDLIGTHHYYPPTGGGED